MQGNNSSINERYKQTLPKIKLQDLKRDVESRFDVVLTSHIHSQTVPLPLLPPLCLIKL